MTHIHLKVMAPIRRRMPNSNVKWRMMNWAMAWRWHSPRMVRWTQMIHSTRIVIIPWIIRRPLVVLWALMEWHLVEALALERLPLEPPQSYWHPQLLPQDVAASYPKYPKIRNVSDSLEILSRLPHVLCPHLSPHVVEANLLMASLQLPFCIF